MSIIHVDNLTKVFKRASKKPGLKGAIEGLFRHNYETKIAVNNISFEIEKGEIVGFIGPNGAGKSTTIKMLVGILQPSEGTVKVSGINPAINRKENAKHIGVVFGQRSQLWWDIPVIESLNLMQYIYKIDNEKFKKNISAYTEILEMKDFLHVPVRQLSLGQRMRADICAALLHDPDILYLDEPTIGLDVVVKKSIHKFIKEINKMNATTVLLTTHDMRDIGKLSSRIIIIDNGSLIYDGSLRNIREKMFNESKIVIDYNVEQMQDLDVVLKGYKYEIDNNKLSISYNPEIIKLTQFIGFLQENFNFTDFSLQEKDIEDIIAELYKTPDLLSVQGGDKK